MLGGTAGIIGRGIALALAALALGASAALGAPVPAGAVWEEVYFESPAGRLHADVLRPRDAPASDKLPVVLTVSPYTGHGAFTADGLDPLATGPSNRFFDFVRLADLFARGYAYVIVDLPGFGGSGGCNDWGGPAEQAGTKAAVEWAGSQPWSNGKVALYGKSYDGWTGLMGLVQRPEHLAAVVSQEPVYDGYRYLYMNRVPFSNRLATPVLFQAYDLAPGAPTAGAQYVLSGTGLTNAACYLANVSQQQVDDPNSEFWKSRNLVPGLRGVRTPTFLMQGFLEDNTKPDAAYEAWNNLEGPNRAWFGQWDHVRGTDGEPDAPMAGRKGYTAEVMRFLDRHLKGVDSGTEDDPRVVVQAFDGRFRSELRWPPADATAARLPLRAGDYADDGANQGTGGGAGNGIWSVSAPFPHDAHLAGTPRVEVDVAAAPAGANLVANVYDVDSNGRAMMISRGAYLLGGPGRAAFELYGQDYPIGRGHRVAVVVSGANSEWFAHEPTMASVSVSGGEAALPFLRYRRDRHIAGGNAAKLVDYKRTAPFNAAAGSISGGLVELAFPPALSALPSLSLRAPRVRGRRIAVSGRAPRGARVRIVLLRGSRVVARRTVRAKRGRFNATLRARRSGRHVVRATGPSEVVELDAERRMRVR